MNVIFGIVFATSMYCFAQAVVSDPGYIPRPAGISEQKKIVEELVVRGEFDARHFCTTCFVRKSLRSKHCRICERCVARHDQYTPTFTQADIVIARGLIIVLEYEPIVVLSPT
jgi:palmitoyltransferase ZDHHC13/17